MVSQSASLNDAKRLSAVRGIARSASPSRVAASECLAVTKHEVLT
jgi:hypothetical protein